MGVLRFGMNTANEEQKVARHKLIQSFVLSLKVKPEFPLEKPTIFGYVDAEDSEAIECLKAGIC